MAASFVRKASCGSAHCSAPAGRRYALARPFPGQGKGAEEAVITDERGKHRPHTAEPFDDLLGCGSRCGRAGEFHSSAAATSPQLEGYHRRHRGENVPELGNDQGGGVQRIEAPPHCRTNSTSGRPPRYPAPGTTSPSRAPRRPRRALSTAPGTSSSPPHPAPAPSPP